MIDEATLQNTLQEITDRHEPFGVHCQAYAHAGEIFIDCLERDLSDATTKGKPATLMNELCQLADKHGLRIELTHMRDEAGLGPYYRRFGLEYYEVPGGNPELVSMRRPPASPKAVAA